MSFVKRFYVEDTLVVVTLYFTQDGAATKDRSFQPKQSHYQTEEEAVVEGLDVNADLWCSAQACYLWHGKNLIHFSCEDNDGRGLTCNGWSFSCDVGTL